MKYSLVISFISYLILFNSCTTIITAPFKKGEPTIESIKIDSLNGFKFTKNIKSFPYKYSSYISNFSPVSNSIKIKTKEDNYIVFDNDKNFKKNIYVVHKSKFYISPQVSYVNKDSNEKFIFIKNASFNSTAIKLNEYNTYNRYINQKPSKTDEFDTDSKIHQNNKSIQYFLNNLLSLSDYMDTNNFSISNTNKLFLSCEIENTTIESVIRQVSTTQQSLYKGFAEIKTTIHWTLNDIYGNRVFDKPIKSTSSQIAYRDFDKLEYIFEDAFEKSLYTFIKQAKDGGFLKKEIPKKFTESKNFTIKKGRSYEAPIQCKRQTVLIKTQLGHGSGAIISKDGYLITNYHVISGSEDSIIVSLNNNREFLAKVQAIDYTLDIALLKIDTNNLNHFIFKKQDVYDAEDILVIGTPFSLKFKNTISKGIISGRRNFDNLEYYQTDAKINPGNSGGPLLNEEGALYGIINAKISGIGIEGLGFAIPINTILKSKTIHLSYE